MIRGKKIAINDLKDFSTKVLMHYGATQEQAQSVTDGLCSTSLKGVDSHGVKLLPHYTRALDKGRIKKNPKLKFEFDYPTAGKLDADHTFGHHAGVVAVKEAIKRAKEFGMCAISVYNSSHFGAAGFFSDLAAKEDMACLSFTHADSLMKSEGGSRPFLGTNPIAFSVPMQDESPYYLDMATTMTTWNKLKSYRSQKIPLESGWAYNEAGEETLNADEATCLAPMGGHKGFALASMVEIFCSIFTGMPFGRSITSMYKEPIENHRYLGQFYIVFNIKAFQPLELFKSRMQEMANEMRGEPSVESSTKVQLPGDPQKNNEKLNIEHGLLVPEEAWEEFVVLAKESQIELPKEVV